MRDAARDRRLPSHRRAGAFDRKTACRTCCARRSYWRMLGRALLEIGYFSLR